MPEPAVANIQSQFHGRIFRRSRLRDQFGPDRPVFHLLEQNAVRDVVVYFDDFLGALDTLLWTASNSGGAGVSNFAQLTAAGDIGGLIRGDAGTTDDGDVRLLGEEIFAANRRCAAIFRVRMPSTVANSKFEVGFIDAAVAGAVLVKATPTSTGTDYAVVVRDTDDDTNLTLVSDGGTDAAGAVDGSFTFATATFYDIMIAVNEQRECAFWVDSQFQGVRRAGPDATVTLAPWAYVQDRDDANNKQLDLDYVYGWQNRTAI